MTTNTDLPPGWAPDDSLKIVIPTPHDHRTFRRLPENPNRYAACILGTGIFDIFQSRFLSPTSTGENNRRRYRLNLGPNTKPARLFYARIVCTLAFGPATSPNHEAHHVDGDRTNDAWSNLRWQTPHQNRTVEVERRTAQSRPVKFVSVQDPDFEYDDDDEETDARYRLCSDSLAVFLSRYDEDREAGRIPDLKRYARFYGISARQLQRITAGKTRQAEVSAIRARRQSTD